MTYRFSLRRSLLRAVLALGTLSLLAACGKDKPEFMGSDITGTRLGQQMSLVDTAGQPRTLADYQGKVMVVFFGFTQCPDVCPTALAEMAQVMQQLGDDADRVQVALVTVDPERDTPQVLREYVTAFDPRFEGLTGTPEQVKQAAQSFKVYYAKSPRPDGDYSMDHTAAIYLLDAKGESRVLVNNTAGVDVLVHDVRTLLELG
ncbi:SCO family protein [Orrella sp. JC864]|uniref:SCO family protein n=1 Tax=Orrella sp. JC864 TaxID=3120298 RepID=UPI0012BBBB36